MLCITANITSVAVWWPGSTNLIHYSLIKTSKGEISCQCSIL